MDMEGAWENMVRDIGGKGMERDGGKGYMRGLAIRTVVWLVYCVYHGLAGALRLMLEIQICIIIRFVRCKLTV